MAEVHRLRALQVGVAGHRPVAGAPARAPAAWPSARSRAVRAASARSRVYIARSVTTWSLRERAVCSLPPDRRRRSPSDAARSPCGCLRPAVASRKHSSRSSRSTSSSPASSASRSSAARIPRAASIRACAREQARSCGHSRRSKPIDAFRRTKSGCWGSRKRDTSRQSRAIRIRPSLTCLPALPMPIAPPPMRPALCARAARLHESSSPFASEYQSLVQRCLRWYAWISRKKHYPEPSRALALG